MYESHLTHPEYQPYLTRAHTERAEAMSRATYLAVLAVDWLATRAARGLVASLRRIVRGYELWQRRRLTVRALARLDERMLRDIGISPGGIEAVAAELAHAVEPNPAPSPVARPVPVSVQPRLLLDLDCPDLKHAA